MKNRSSLIPRRAQRLVSVLAWLAVSAGVLPAQTVTFARQALGQPQTVPLCNGGGGTTFNWPNNSNWSEQQVTATDSCNHTYVTEPTNWSTPTYPNGANIDIVIPGGNSVNLSIGTTTLHSLTIQAGGGMNYQNSSTTASTYTLQGDGSISAVGVSGGNPFMYVPGTLAKTGGNGTFSISPTLYVILQNATVQVASGTLTLSGLGGGTGATFNVATGATLNLDGGGNNNSYTGTYTSTGGGTVLLASGSFASGNTQATINFPGSNFQWTGGSLLNVANAGVINLSGADTKVASTLVNNGTILFGGTGPLSGYTPSGYAGSFNLVNAAGATVKLLSDNGPTNYTFGSSNLSGAGFGGTISNSGLLWKAAGTGVSTLSPQNVSYNSTSGTIRVDAGTLVLPGLGVSTGATTFQIAAGAVLNLDGGGNNATYVGTLTASGGGTVLLAGGGNLSAQNAPITINFPDAMFQWTGGLMREVINSAVINLAGPDSKVMSHVTNNGTILFGGTGPLVGYSASGYGGSFTLDNPVSGVVKILGDDGPTNLTFGNAGSGIGGFGGTINNRGLFWKAGGTGRTTLSNQSVGFSNVGGTIQVDSGTLVLPGSGVSTGGGIFNVAVGATLDLNGGGTNANFVGTYTGGGGGTVLFAGGQINNNDLLTFNFPGAMFQWTAGGMQVGLINSGTMNLAGPGSKSLVRLANNGIFNVGGSGAFGIGDTFSNSASGTIALLGDAPINGGIISNAGIFRKNGPTGATVIGSNTFNNTGTVTLQTGSVQFSSFTNSATVQVMSGTAISFTGYHQTGGTLQLDNTTATAGVNGFTFDGGTVTGNGTLVGNVTNNASLTIGSTNGGGSGVTITGNYAQFISSTLNVNIGGNSAGAFGMLTITGNAHIDGALNVNLVNGWKFRVGDTYRILTARTFDGLTDFRGVTLPAGVQGSLSASGGTIALTITAAPPAASLINLATRARVETLDNVMIAGFVIGGTGNKRLMVRAIGPDLTRRGVAGALSNPTLSLFGPGGQLAVNDNWKDTQAAEIAATPFAPVDDRESAIIATLPPGPYTAIVSGVGGEMGVGLVEVYDLDTANVAGARPVNVATRARVQTGDNILIGGFVIAGTRPRRVIVRAIGPELTGRGVAGALQDPVLTIVNAQGVNVAVNDNWKDTQAAEIAGTPFAPTDDRESAVVLTLDPGAYTALVTGKNGTTGVALVEVYDLE